MPFEAIMFAPKSSIVSTTTRLTASVLFSPAHTATGSGSLVFRRNINRFVQVKVTAQLGNLSATSNVDTLTADSTPTGILISPNRMRTDGKYPFSQRLDFTLVKADGYYQNNQSTNQITFTTDDPTVTVTAGGTVNVTTAPTVEKVVTVTATYKDGTNPPVQGVCTVKLGKI